MVVVYNRVTDMVSYTVLKYFSLAIECKQYVSVNEHPAVNEK